MPGKHMVAKKIKYAAMGFAIDLAMIGIMTASYFYFIPTYRQMCGETSVYFVKFSLYGCDSNAEAAVDFECYGQYGSIQQALLVKPMTQAQCIENYNDSIRFGLDYLETLEEWFGYG
jgi:hypothetical protein